MFIRQSIRSNNCAPYATATFLGLLGRVMNRTAALSAFGVRRRGWSGASHEDMSRVVEAAIPGVKTKWLHLRARKPCTVLAKLANATAVHPLLVTARCLHLRHDVADWHAFVVVDAIAERATLLDPLAPHPVGDRAGNSTLFSANGTLTAESPGTAGRWSIDLDFRVSAMVLTPVGIACLKCPRPAVGVEITPARG